MADRVQPFITLRFGSLWFDVPVGPFQAAHSDSSLQTTAASSNPADHEQEMSSIKHDGFIPVVSKSTRRRRRRAAARARVAASQQAIISVREPTSSDSVPPGFTRAISIRTKTTPINIKNKETSPRFRRTTL
uniref:Uncharacterized protein n=1 Tax=Oryza brachyantha TaxID=4533 RepID=J3MCF3_ORYBR